LTHKRVSLKPGSYKGVERHLLRHCKPLHDVPLAKIDRRAVAGRISAVAAKSGFVEANRVSSSLAAFFAWCLREGLVDTNPAAGGNRAPEQSRARVLNDDELKAIWGATDGDDDYASVVRLLMLTGARASEIGGLRFSEIIDGRIVLPATRTKNAREHAIPLAPVARALLDARTRRTDRDFVFGRRQNRPFTGWSVCKTKLDARLGSAVPHWTHHDLRRSMSTRMAESLDIEPHIIEAVLNHVSGHKHGVAGVYNRARYEQQKTTALLRWADYVLAVVEGRRSKVIPLSVTKRQV
jgi:integrase